MLQRLNCRAAAGWPIEGPGRGLVPQLPRGRAIDCECSQAAAGGTARPSPATPAPHPLQTHSIPPPSHPPTPLPHRPDDSEGTDGENDEAAADDAAADHAHRVIKAGAL
jgi:hypothetical protein